jgi:tetratricopeptide (TPR) repeat protein
MSFFLIAATLAAPNPWRHQPPTAEGLVVMVRPGVPAAAARTGDQLSPAASLGGPEFPVVRELPGRVLVRSKGVDHWVSRAEVMTPKEAVEYYTQQIAAQPQSTLNFTRRAKAHELAGDWDAAIKDYDEAIKLSPRSSAYFNNRANYFSRKRQYEKALEGYEEALKLSPTSYIPMGNRANVYMNLRDWDRAVEAYDQAIKTNPTYARAYAGRSGAWREKREYDKAVADAERALELDGTSPHAYQARGLVRAALQEYDKALADFEEVLRFDPLFAAGYFGRAGVHLARKAYQPAIRDLDTAVRLWSGNAAAMTRRAEAWVALGNHRRALLDLDEATNTDDRYAPAYRQKAWLLATCPDDTVRDGKAAVEAARKALELAKDSGGATWEALAAALAEAGDFAGAVEWQTKAAGDARYVKEKGDAVKGRLALYESKKPYRDSAGR